MRHTLFFLIVLFTTTLSAQYKNKSIGFIENKGQIIDQKGKPNPTVQYLLNSNGLNVQIKKNGFSYDIYETKKHLLTENQKAKLSSSSLLEKDNKNAPDYSLEYIYHRIDIDFINSNSKVELISEEKSTDYDNYYNVPNKPEGVLMVHKFKQITYKNIYPNIDVVFTIPKDTLKTVEYNFVVHPKGKISDIQLKFNGAETDLVDNKIQMQVRFGEMEETLPMSWTEDGKCKKEIAVGYKKIKNNVYGFESDSPILGKTVIIDPVPTRLWGTYYGGNGGDYSLDICNDIKNNIYFSGYTASTTNIATTGTFPTPYYYNNGYVVKFNSNGIRVWGTYYSTYPSAINVDTNENLYFTGSASGETNVSTSGSHQPIHEGYYNNAYLVKLNPSGVREWGTYYGGKSSDKGQDISFDILNNVYLVGSAESLENIASNNAFQPIHAPGYLDSDGFIAKFNPQGTRIWGTYYGGISGDFLNSVSVSDDGFLYVTGITRSDSGIATLNSFQPNFKGYEAGIIAKFTLDGQRVWGSYFNGERFADITKSKLKNNFLYVIGKTDSHNNLISANTFNTTYQPTSFTLDGLNSFIVKFDINTQKEVWGTYFGEVIQDLDINSKDNVIFEGCTEESKGIATANSYSTSPQYEDGYMIKLNENGQRVWGTYYGGNFSEGSNGAADVNNKITIDHLDNIYLVGNTGSSLGISTPGSYQEHYSLNSQGGLYNVYLAKFQDCQSNPIASSNSPICIGNSLELKASGGTNYAWTGPNGFISSDQNPIISNATASYSGQYSCTITGTGGCDDTIKIDVIVGDIENPIPDLANLPIITGDCHTTIITIPTATDTCSGKIIATTTSPLSYSLPGMYSIDWEYKDESGNISNQGQIIIITSQILPVAISPQIFCIQQNATLSDISITGQNIKWYDALFNGNLLNNTTLLQNSTTYYASQTINGCESDRIDIKVIVEDNQAPIPNLTILPTITGDCHTQITTIPTATDTCAGAIIATTTSPISYNLPGTYTIVWNYDDGNNNSVNQNQTVIITAQPLPTTTSPQIFCVEQNATINNISITGQNIKWYDVLINGNLLTNTTSLQDGITYYASQTINNCESSNIPVLIHIQNTAAPTANASQSFCTSQNPYLNTIAITGANIKWYDRLTTGNLLADTTPLQDGETYYASQTISNCESATRIPVTVSLISSLPAQNYTESFCDDLNDGKETVNLNDYNADLILNNSNYSFTYYTSLSAAQNETANGEINNATNYKLILGENKIYVRINSNTPCSGIAELKFTLLPQPKITISDIVPLCENKSVIIDAGTGFDSYVWSNGATTRTITVAEPDTYSVTVTKNYSSISCSNTKNFTVKESNIAVINTIETDDWTDTNNIITVFASGAGDYEYSMDGNNYQDSNVFSGLDNGKYTIQVRDKNGCGIIKSDEVYLLMYPKFFTPNGDNYNDTWKIKLSDFEEGLTVKIFDRYGKLLKTLANNTAEWNGTYNGEDLPSSDYWFVVSRANGKEHKGHFSLKR